MIMRVSACGVMSRIANRLKWKLTSKKAKFNLEYFINSMCSQVDLLFWSVCLGHDNECMKVVEDIEHFLSDEKLLDWI